MSALLADHAPAGEQVLSSSTSGRSDTVWTGFCFALPHEDEADSTKEVWHNGVTIKKYYTTKRNHDICTDKWVEREDVWEMYDAKELRFCDAAIATRVDELLERRKVLESELDTADKDLVAFEATAARAEDDQQDDQQDEVVQVDE